MSIEELLSELDQSLDVISELTTDPEYIEAWNKHQENQRLRYNGYSFQNSQRIEKIFDRYHAAFRNVQRFKEYDPYPSKTEAQLEDNAYLYSAVKLN